MPFAWCCFGHIAFSQEVASTIIKQYNAIDSIVTKKAQKDIGVFPAPTFNPSFGTGLSIIPFIIFNIDSTQITHPSSVQGVLYTNFKGSRALGAKGTFYTKENKLWIDAYASYVDMEFQYYDNISHLGSDKYESVNFEGLTSNFSVLYQFKPKFYLGPIVNINYLRQSTTDVSYGGNKEYTWYIAPGLKLSYDTREDIYFPTHSWFVEGVFQGMVNKIVGGDKYEKIRLGVSNYTKISDTKNLVFANRFYSQIGFDNLPLFEKASPGPSPILRGYIRGNLIDNSIITLQSEMRYMFTERWGAVAFVGAGTLFDQLNSIEDGVFLPSGGLGLRFKAFRSLKLNAAFDVAVGRSSYALYFRFSEAF